MPYRSATTPFHGHHPCHHRRRPTHVGGPPPLQQAPRHPCYRTWRSASGGATRGSGGMGLTTSICGLGLGRCTSAAARSATAVSALRSFLSCAPPRQGRAQPAAQAYTRIKDVTFHRPAARVRCGGPAFNNSARASLRCVRACVEGLGGAEWHPAVGVMRATLTQVQSAEWHAKDVGSGRRGGGH